MTGRVILGAGEWRGADGLDELVISRATTGVVHISVHDRKQPGLTVTFDRAHQLEMAEFLADRGDRWRRSWPDSRSRLTIDHDPGGRVFITVDAPGVAATAVSFGTHATADIAAFLRGG